MNSDVPRTPGIDPAKPGTAPTGTGNVCDDAIAEVVRLILELTSANGALDHANSARLRGELEHALREAQSTFDLLPEGPARADALHRLDGLQIVARRQLESALPIDPSARLTHVEGYTAAPPDPSARLPDAGPPRRPRRPRSGTKPESPGAMGAEPKETDRVTPNEPFVPLAPEDFALEKKPR